MTGLLTPCREVNVTNRKREIEKEGGRERERERGMTLDRMVEDEMKEVEGAAASAASQPDHLSSTIHRVGRPA